MSDYKQLLKQAEALRFKFKDVVDQPGDSHARAIASDIDGLVNDVKAERNPQGIADRLNNLEHHLRQLDGEVMDYIDSQHLAKWCEELRQEVRHL